MDPLPGQLLCVLGNRHAFDPVTGICNSLGGISFLGFRSHCHPPFCFHHTTAEEKYKFFICALTPNIGAFRAADYPGAWSKEHNFPHFPPFSPPMLWRAKFFVKIGF